MKTPPQTIKLYSKARWNGVYVLFKSVLDNKGVIGEVFTAQQMCPMKDRGLDLTLKSKA